MSPAGPKIFQGAIAFEIFANLASLPALFYNQDVALSYMLEDPSRNRSDYQFALKCLGVLVVGVSVPLALAYPNPAPGAAGNGQRLHRFATYFTLGASEILIAALALLLPKYHVDTGLSSRALHAIFVTMCAFVSMRAFFVVVKPSWIRVNSSNEKKKQ